MPLFNCFLTFRIRSKLTIDLNLRALCPSSTHLQLTYELTMQRPYSTVFFCFPAFLVLQLFQPSSAQYTARFQYPTGGEVYNVLDTVVMQWTSNYASTTLFTWIWDVTSDDGQEGALQMSFPSYPANVHKTDSLRVLRHAPKWLSLLQALSSHAPSRSLARSAVVRPHLRLRTRTHSRRERKVVQRHFERCGADYMESGLR